MGLGFREKNPERFGVGGLLGFQGFWLLLRLEEI